MNDSNNILGNNNVTPTPQPNTTNGVSSTSEINNSVNNAYVITPSVQQSQTSQPNQNINVTQPQNTYNTQLNNTISSNNQNIESNQINDEELLRVFIGKNYEKITTRPFNFAGFFFTSFYMFYRKIFGYALIVFLLNLVVLNIVNNFLVTIAFGVLVGFFVNKIYLSYAKKKIAIIKASNPQKSFEELKTLCANKGGTSIGKIFLGFITELGIALVVLFVMMLVGIGGAIGEFLNLDNWNITVNDSGNTNNENNNTNSKDKKLIETVIVSGYTCLESRCNVSIDDSNGNSVDYELGVSNNDLFNELGDYKDYIKLDIYYTQKGKTKTIVDYRILLKSNSEDISSVKNVDELRNKIGLYLLGTHTDILTLTEVGMTGFGYIDDQSYTYTSYTFVDNNNNEYEMKYINDNGLSNLVEGNKYNVTFEVTEGMFNYEYTIKSIN